MPKKAETRFNKFKAKVNQREIRRTKIENLFTNDILDENDVFIFYEGLFIGLFTDFEQFIEELFLGLLEGKITINGCTLRELRKVKISPQNDRFYGLGKYKKEINRDLDVKEYRTPKDSVHVTQLQRIAQIEDLAAKYIVRRGFKPIEAVREAAKVLMIDIEQPKLGDRVTRSDVHKVLKVRSS